jgi:hypothetical protein
MLDLKAIAAARGLDIPADQLERIGPVMEKLNNELRRVLESVPDAPEFAIQFQAREDAE